MRRNFAQVFVFDDKQVFVFICSFFPVHPSIVGVVAVDGGGRDNKFSGDGPGASARKPFTGIGVAARVISLSDMG